MPANYQINGSKAVGHENPGVFVVTFARRFRYETVIENEKTKYAHWQDKHVLQQSIWSEGQTLRSDSGPIEKSELAKFMTLYR